MKNLLNPTVFMLILVSLGFLQCSGEKDSEMKPVAKIDFDTISFTSSMKGWELYSWPNGADWNHSLLPGTNRLKSYVEVTSNRLVIFGSDSLKMLLDKLPEGEEIFWIGRGWLGKAWGSGYGDLTLPDENTLNEIKAYCLQNNLVLRISD